MTSVGAGQALASTGGSLGGGLLAALGILLALPATLVLVVLACVYGFRSEPSKAAHPLAVLATTGAGLWLVVGITSDEVSITVRLTVIGVSGLLLGLSILALVKAHRQAARAEETTSREG
ncbi:MAG: hypothetical protein KC503_42920 [Myxococcales bacterium]|nr:hypothetical protein [Myxococcales bacterium]